MPESCVDGCVQVALLYEQSYPTVTGTPWFDSVIADVESRSFRFENLFEGIGMGGPQLLQQPIAGIWFTRVP